MTAIEAYPSLAALLAAWRSGCTDGLPPRRIDPLAMPRALLPYALLTEWERGTGRLRVRLAGTMLCELSRCELKGRALDEILPADDAAALTRSARAAARRRQPLLIQRIDMPWPEMRLDYVALLLPMVDIQGHVDRWLEMPDPASMQRHGDRAR